MYAQKVHTYNIRVNSIITMLLNNVYITILTLTSEYRGTVTNLQTSFFTVTADWG